MIGGNTVTGGHILMGGDMVTVGSIMIGGDTVTGGLWMVSEYSQKPACEYAWVL